MAGESGATGDYLIVANRSSTAPGEAEMGDRREQMTIVGPDFRLARLESGRGVNGVAGSQGNVGGGERISMAVLRNSDSVTGIRFVPLHHPNAPRAFGSASAYFTPMSSLLTRRFAVGSGRVVGYSYKAWD